MHRGIRCARSRCLGVLRCELCGYLWRPLTQEASRTRQLTKPCPNKRCGVEGTLEELLCEAVFFRYTEHRNGQPVYIWEHRGDHTHPRPPGGSLTHAEAIAVDEQVLRRPGATVHQLRTGDPAPGSVPLADISPTLANPRKARYAVAQSQARLGLHSNEGKGAFAAVQALGDLNTKLGVRFVQESRVEGPTYFVLRTPFMDLTMRDSVVDWVADLQVGDDVGRHGLVIDGDHSFFRTGTLLATCAFNKVLGQWVPVLYSWILHLDIGHHRPHFRYLNASIVEAAGRNFDKKHLCAVSAHIKGPAARF